MKPHQSSLLIAGVISVLLWLIPGVGFVLLPLQYLNTHLHELSHAIVGVATGGSVENIHVFSDGSGVTMIGGGIDALTNAAGYLGATIFGGLMIFFSRSERGAAITLRVLGCVLAAGFVLWVRGDFIGVISGLFWIAALLTLPSFTRGRNLVFIAQLLGMQQCLESIQALYVLFRISSTFHEAHSDAANMAASTGIPAIVWASLWAATGIGVLYVTLRSAWKNHPKS